MSLPSILIVEDERIVAYDLGVRLRRLGYAVSAIVSSGEEALEHVRTARPDLVVMDMTLRGGLSGMQTAQQLWERFRLPIVYLTAQRHERDKPSTPPRCGYVVKPYEEETLRAAIEQVLQNPATEIPPS